MKESSIIEYIKQGMRQARFREIQKRIAARALHMAEHPEKYEPVFERNRIKSNSINITLNFLKKHWTAGDAELEQHIKILFDNNIIKNVDTVFDIQSEASAVELLCLLNFWINYEYLDFKRLPLKNICRCFTYNDGHPYDDGELKRMNSNYKKDGEFSDDPHERYKYFQNILSEN